MQRTETETAGATMCARTSRRVRAWGGYMGLLQCFSHAVVLCLRRNPGVRSSVCRLCAPEHPRYRQHKVWTRPHAGLPLHWRLYVTSVMASYPPRSQLPVVTGLASPSRLHRCDCRCDCRAGFHREGARTSKAGGGLPKARNGSTAAVVDREESDEAAACYPCLTSGATCDAGSTTKPKTSKHNVMTPITDHDTYPGRRLALI